MGMGPISYLSYGYDLGGGDSDWKLLYLDSDGRPKTDWWPDSRHVHDFPDDVIHRLLVVNGFTERREDGLEGYYFRKEAARRRLGVDVLTYGSYDYPSGYVICHSSRIRASWSSVEFDPTVPKRADEILEAAIKALGLHPTQKSPRWILSSFYG